MIPRLDGGLHLVLVVRDAERSAEWYNRVFGFENVRKTTTAAPQLDSCGKDTPFTFTSLFHVATRQFLGLAQPNLAAAQPFNWRQAGLQHFGFHVSERAALDEWASHLDKLGIAHSTIFPEGPGELVRFYDPDHIPVEVFWPNMPRCEELWRTLARSRARAGRERRNKNRVA